MSTATLSRFVFPADVPSSLTETEGRKLAELADGRLVLELGAWQGRSTICLAQAARRVHSVDWHQGDPHAGEGATLVSFLTNVYRYGLKEQVVVHLGRFEDVLDVFRLGHFGLVFLDGFHTYEAVSRDLDACVQLIEEGGVLACHDYGVQASSHGGGPFGVTEAINERFQVDEVVDTLAIVRSP